MMKDHGLQNYLLVKLWKTILKIVHLNHHIKFLSVFKMHDVTLKRLEIKQTPKIFPASNSSISE